MNPTGALLAVVGVFIIGRLLFKDSNGQTLAGRLAGGQPGAGVGTVNAEGTITANTSATAAQPAAPIITSKGGGALNARQLTFANTLSRLTGLNSAVVKGWVLGEEPPSSTAAPNGANNWLNIGDTGSGNYAGNNPAWNNPVTAAVTTAAWLKGQPLPGYGAASSGIRAILGTSKETLGRQVAAIQGSGWASGGYPSLPTLVSEFR